MQVLRESVITTKEAKETMYDVGRSGSLGIEQLPREVCGKPEHRSAERRSAVR